MQRPLIPQQIVVAMIVAALLLPIAICVVFGVAALLAEMGDAIGGMVLHRIALGLGIVWAIELLCLLVVLAIGAVGGPHEPDGPQ
jgi:hypothetical protein